MAVAHDTLSRLKFERDVATLTDGFASRLRLLVHSRQWPVLDVTVEHSAPIRLRFYSQDWDDMPPSIELLDTDGGLYAGRIPGGQFHPGPHPATGRPFVCMRGSREYHLHPNHLNDSWDHYRGRDGMGLVGLVMQLGGAWRRGT